MSDTKELATTDSQKPFNPNAPKWELIEYAVDRIDDAYGARAVIDEMAILEPMVFKAAGENLKRFATEFARLEAALWINVSRLELSDTDRSVFTRAELNLLAWLRGKTEAGLRKVAATCATGKRIASVRSDEVSKRNHEDKCAELARISDLIVSEAKETGITTLTSERFYTEWSIEARPDVRSVNAYREQTKNRMLGDGIIGCHDEKHTYMSMDGGDAEKKAEAIACRIDNIASVIDSLRRICVGSDLTVPRSAVEMLHERVDGLPTGR